MGKLCEIGEWRAGVYEMRTYQGKSHLQNDRERRAKCGVMRDHLRVVRALESSLEPGAAFAGMTEASLSPPTAPRGN